MTNTIPCPQCQVENPNENVFCQACGAYLQNQPAASASAALPPVPPPAPLPLLGSPKIEFSGKMIDMPQIFPPQQPVYMTPPSLHRLGKHMDGFIEVLPDMASKAGIVQKAFLKEWETRKLPLVTIGKSDFSAPGGTRHTYDLAYHSVGATAAVGIFPFGADLMVTWDIFVPRRFRWVALAILAAIAVILPIPFAFISLDQLAFLTLNPEFTNPSVFIWGIYFLGFFSLLLAGPAAAMLLGKLIFGDALFLLLKRHDPADRQEVAALAINTHRAVLKGIEKTGIKPDALTSKNNLFKKS